MRTLRRLAITLVLLTLIVVAADFSSRWLAESVVAQRIRQTQQLSADPSVTIEGFPFLTQLVAGRLNEVRVTAAAPAASGSELTLDTIEADLQDVSAPLTALLSGSADGQVKIGRATLSTVIGYQQIATALTKKVAQLNNLVLEGSADGVITITTRVALPNTELPLSLPATLTLNRGRLTLAVSEQDLAKRAPKLSPLVLSTIAKYLTITVVVPRLTYGLIVDDVSVTPAGIRVSATGTGLDLAVP